MNANGEESRTRENPLKLSLEINRDPILRDLGILILETIKCIADACFRDDVNFTNTASTKYRVLNNFAY